MARKRLLFQSLIFMLGAISCSVATVSPMGKGEVFQLEEDEKRLWNTSLEEQKKLDQSGLIYQDPQLKSYINEVAMRVIPPEIKGTGVSFEVKVIKNPLLNAFSFPNGVIYIHTGFLARMENEAQLAIVLAHEISHVTYRHLLQQFRSVKNASAFLTTLQVVAAPAGIYGVLPSLLGQVGTLAAVSGYSRAMEEEADQEGLRLVVGAGYDPQEAPKLFDALDADLKEQKIEEPFLFGTHPHLEARKESYTQLLENAYADRKGMKGEDRFEEATHVLLLDNALLDLSMGRFDFAKEAIQRFLKTQPESARAHYNLGEVYRKSGAASELQISETEYRWAVQYDPGYPEPHKGLGRIYLKQGRLETAKEEFEKYLLLAPQAEDRQYIEQYLQGNPQNEEAQN